MLPAWLISEWMEYERLEPFGSWRDNWHAAIVATILANAFRSRNTSPVRLSEFMFKDPVTAREEEDLQTLAHFRAMKKH